MRNKKIMLAVAAVTMCAASFTFVTACNNHTHEYEWTTTKAPTCTAKGLETGVCPADSDTVTRELDIDANAHAYGEWVITAPTSELPGKAYKTCGNDATHIAEQVLPKLGGSEYKMENGENGKTKFIFAHALGDIVFEADVTHVYSGALTLEKAPTFNSFGLATKACYHGAADDALKVYVPMLGVESDDVTINQTKAPTADACGKATYTFKYGDETVVYEVDVPATTSAEDKFLDMFTGNSYKHADKVGKVEATKLTVGKSGSSSSVSLNYECGDGFTHVRNDDDRADLYYYATGETGEGAIPVRIIKVDDDTSEDAPAGAKRAPIWYTSGEDAADKEVDAAGMNGAFYMYTPEIGAYGIDNFAKIIYNNAPVDDNGDPVIKYASWQDGENVVYAFSYNAFSQREEAERESNGDPILDADGKQLYRLYDSLTVTTVAFTADASGMAKSWEISMIEYSYDYKSGEPASSTEPEEPENPDKPEPKAADGQKYYQNALNAANPIKGYEDGNYFVYPDANVTRETRFTATVTDKASAGAIESPYDFNAITSAGADFDFKIKDGEKLISSGGVVECDTSGMVNLSIADTPESIPVSLLDCKVFLVTEEGGEETEDEIGYYGTAVSGYTNGSDITLYCRYSVGDYKIRVKINGATFDFIYRSVACKPNTVTPSIIAYDPSSDTYATKKAGSASVYAGETFYVSANTSYNDSWGDSGRATDQEYKVFLKNGENETQLTQTDDKGIICKFDQKGDYLLVVKSTADETVTAEITVTVKEAPDMATVFDGTYKQGSNIVEFKADNKVTITDAKGTVTYTYAYDAGARKVMLSSPDGTAHTNSYSLEVNPAYGLVLVYGANGENRELLFKGLRIEDVISSHMWLCDGAYAIFKPDGTAVITSNPTKTQFDQGNDLILTYRLEEGNGGYALTFALVGYGPFGVGTGSWLHDGNMNSDNLVVFEDGEVKSVKIAGKNFEMIKSAAESACDALIGTKWTYYDSDFNGDNHTVTFTSASELTISYKDYDENWNLTTLNDTFSYTLVETDTAGLFTIVITGNDTNSDWCIEKAWGEVSGTVKVENGAVTEIEIPVKVDFDKSNTILTAVEA